jgi:hypothetical protein
VPPHVVAHVLDAVEELVLGLDDLGQSAWLLVADQELDLVVLLQELVPK